MIEFVQDNSDYEAWLRQRCQVNEKGLQKKHVRMTQSPFMFLRATYFRWAKCAAEFAPECVDDRVVLAIGDCHIENFGTWHDGDSRPVWGVNDFDDAAEMPYSLDLVRLATSALLSEALEIPRHEACEQIISGYQKGLRNPSPVILDQKNQWLANLFRKLHEHTEKFWERVDKEPSAVVPDDARLPLQHALPANTGQLRLASWQRGGGSLGRPRYLAAGYWQGGRILREAKKLVPSGWEWAHQAGGHDSRFMDVASGKYRSPDPVLSVRNGYVIRRLAPDGHKLSAEQMAQAAASAQLLHKMAHDIGSVHAASDHADEVLSDLGRRPVDWLTALTAKAEAFVHKDYDEWRQRMQRLRC